jgi:tetratricopeptide (TPR) repeat protein
MPIAHIAPGTRVLTCLLVLVALLARPQSARAQAEESAVVDKITKMNKKAVEEYENLNFEESRKILKEALDLATQNGLDKHPIKARTHIHLGVVILAGFKQRELAIKQFRKALEIQPDIKLTKSLANPEIQEAFDEAVAGLGKPEKPEGTEGGGDKTVNNEGLKHDAVTHAAQGNPIPITATVEASLNAKKVVLAYRPDGASDFIGREMKEGPPSYWTAEIPGSATQGNTVAYYIEAQNEEGEAVASKGTSGDPMTVAIKGAGAPEVKKGEEEEEEADHHWYLALGLGSGLGWTTGNGEVNADDVIKPAGFAPAKAFHGAPEVGYFVKPDLMLSLQLRLQYVSGATSEIDPSMTMCGSDHVCQPAKNAFAALARVTKFFSESGFRPYVAGMAGGGQIRHVAEFASVKTCGTDPAKPVTCVDTVAAGPVLVGGGAGFVYNATPNVGLTLGLNALLGFPTFTFHVDFNGGVAVMF